MASSIIMDIATLPVTNPRIGTKVGIDSMKWIASMEGGANREVLNVPSVSIANAFAVYYCEWKGITELTFHSTEVVDAILSGLITEFQKWLYFITVVTPPTPELRVIFTHWYNDHRKPDGPRDGVTGRKFYEARISGGSGGGGGGGAGVAPAPAAPPPSNDQAENKAAR